MEHRCPRCGELWEGEPFDSAWIGLAHSKRGQLMKQLAVMQALELDMEALSNLRDAFLDYARYYAGFEVHGDIPYNGPGKLFAQTLDESHWIMDLALAYQWVGDQFEPEEREYIMMGLFRPCAHFLIDYKERQIHNHAVLITSAISILGFILHDADIQRAGLDGDFGLYDQIARGVLPDGFWYEGAFTYHYYAMEPILQYALTVEGSDWDIRRIPSVNDALKRMFDFPLRFLLPGGMFPALNDASKVVGIESFIPYYEFASGWFGDELYRELLTEVYAGGKSRDSLFALICGSPMEHRDGGQRQLIPKLASEWHCSEGSGLTKLVNRQGYHVIVKHSPFSGEHDHMDRLALSFGFEALPIFSDPGTVAYAVPAHYDWFKHTYSHNTVCLNGADQPPADCRLIASGEEQWGQWAASSVSWGSGEYRMEGSIILPEEMCPWNESAYDGSSITRINALTDHLLLDLIKVNANEGTEVDLPYHVSGAAEWGGNWKGTDYRLSLLKQGLFKDKRKRPATNVDRMSWTIGKLRMDQLFWSSEACTLYAARTPDNPPDRDRQSLIQRLRIGIAGEAWIMNVFAVDGTDVASFSVREQADQSFELTVGGGSFEERFVVRCLGEQVELRMEEL
nr:heparinase II/III family protein [Paenibacillus soyae]